MPNITVKKRSRRIRKKLKKVNTNRYRLSVNRSLKNISAQIIDDTNSLTLVSASSSRVKGDVKMKKSDLSVKIAEILAKKALDKKITTVYFDRGGYKYHGRIKIFAETLRKNGLNF
jgi:large subunit ribosomal protein L18|tara:strand:- start:76 stop:423 length:348 start_codon:yes stop_codon:yes gene_type:complete